MNLGYACLNRTLESKDIRVNRSMIKKTFREKGINYASEVSLGNIQNLAKVIDWNISNNIYFYRMSSEMFPWMSEYELEELPDIVQIRNILQKIGKQSSDHHLRLTFHPGQFNVLSTKNERVLKNTLKELRQHGEIMDMAGLPRSPFSKINIHVGGAFGNKNKTLLRFIDHFHLLPESVSARLTLENDDKPGLYSLRDLLPVSRQIPVPLVFDFFHHQFCSGGWDEEKAFKEALSTWPPNIKPIIHFSSSKKKYENATAHKTTHADYIYQKINLYGEDVDVMLEAKAKEKAVFRYIEEFK